MVKIPIEPFQRFPPPSVLLLSTSAIYSIVGEGLAALGILINQSALRILKALELSGQRDA